MCRIRHDVLWPTEAQNTYPALLPSQKNTLAATPLAFDVQSRSHWWFVEGLGSAHEDLPAHYFKYLGLGDPFSVNPHGHQVACYFGQPATT